MAKVVLLLFSPQPAHAQRALGDMTAAKAQQFLEALDRDPEKRKHLDPKSLQALKARARYVNPEVARTAHRVVKGVRGDKSQGPRDLPLYRLHDRIRCSCFEPQSQARPESRRRSAEKVGRL